LKETLNTGDKLDVLLYTRGGATNAVWPIVSLLREFDSNFEVLVPYRAHSSGTMLTLAAKKIVMTRLAELSPIDPTTANQFNPQLDKQLLGIAVEDVTAYKEFWQSAVASGLPAEKAAPLLQPYLAHFIHDPVWIELMGGDEAVGLA
jgi:ClpP class serine protease